MQLILDAIKGPDAGRSFELPMGCYRVIGRSFALAGGTAIVPSGERRRLDAEDQRLISLHLQRRAKPGVAGARADVASFDRGDDIDLSDDAVSQTHALVFYDEAGLTLVDVSSTNGSFVNGDRVADAELVVGDLLRVGETRLEVKRAML